MKKQQTPGAQHLLIIANNDPLRELLASVLAQAGFMVDAFSGARDALRAFEHNSYDCVLADFDLPGTNGLETLKALREHSNLPCLILTDHSAPQRAVDAIRAGAHDFITKPFEPGLLCSYVRDVLTHQRIIQRQAMPLAGVLETRDLHFLKMLESAARVASVDSGVLLIGEPGSEKEAAARYIHAHSKRAHHPFVALDCASLPTELLESELFGHIRGAFSDATQARCGFFEFASEGTIFLDEINALPPALQVKLLTALQDGAIRPVGSDTSLRAGPRIIAAMNSDAEDALRRDCYYRVAVVALSIPPLRERPGDIETLARHFVDLFADKRGHKPPALSDEALEFLRRHRLPGNIRELESIIQRAVIVAGSRIEVEHLGLGLDISFETLHEANEILSAITEQAVRKAEMDLITQTLRQTMGNKSKTAQLLGMPYKRLCSKVKEYRLTNP